MLPVKSCGKLEPGGAADLFGRIVYRAPFFSGAMSPCAGDRPNIRIVGVGADSFPPFRGGKGRGSLLTQGANHLSGGCARKPRSGDWMCSAQLTPEGVWGLALKAQGEEGYERRGPSSHYWDIAGNCEKPRGTTIVARPWRSFRHYWRSPLWRSPIPIGPIRTADWQHSCEVVMQVRCRRCTKCMRHRRWIWRDRAVNEARASTRMWAGTLTFSAQEVFLMNARIDARMSKRGWNVAEIGNTERFRLIQNEAGRLATKWLKRLRKAGQVFRYMLVAERHASGLPHFHVITHELATPLRKCCKDCRLKKAAFAAGRGAEWRTGQGCCLEASWPHGFTKFKLIPSGDENRAVGYFTKYIAKDYAARIRASIRYGVGDGLDRNQVASESPLWARLKGAPSLLSVGATLLKKEARTDHRKTMWDKVHDRGEGQGPDSAFLAHLDLVWPVSRDGPLSAPMGARNRGIKDALCDSFP